MPIFELNKEYYATQHTMLKKYPLHTITCLMLIMHAFCYICWKSSEKA